MLGEASDNLKELLDMDSFGVLEDTHFLVSKKPSEQAVRTAHKTMRRDEKDACRDLEEAISAIIKAFSAITKVQKSTYRYRMKRRARHTHKAEEDQRLAARKRRRLEARGSALAVASRAETGFAELLDIHDDLDDPFAVPSLI